MLRASAREIGFGGLCALALVIQLATVPRGLYAQTAAPVGPADAARPEPSNSGADARRVHVVGPGENLWRIAFESGVELDDLARANGIEDPSRIAVGQRLVIPTDGTRAVGDDARQLEALLQGAENALAVAQFERARQLTRAAREELEREGGTAERVRLEVIDATIAVAYGRDDAAVGSLERALAADPNLTLDPRSTTPKLLAALEIARGRRSAASLPPVSAPTP